MEDILHGVDGGLVPDHAAKECRLALVKFISLQLKIFRIQNSHP